MKVHRYMKMIRQTNPVGDNKHELTINLFLFLMHIFENRFEKYIYSFTKKKNIFVKSGHGEYIRW